MSTLPHAGEMFVERYHLQEVLGEGGFARVFRATDVELGRDVAIKVLKPGDGPAHDSSAERFLKEMKLVAAVRDEHVVTLFDYGRTGDGAMYMVLELVGGRDLSDIVKDGPISEDAALTVMRQLLVALRAAHRAGMLHRDVKPGNIRVYEYMGDPWRVKLLDFGIAKTLVDDASLTATGMAVGTPRFMTPEQLYGEPLGPTTDLYSLAVVTYEMLTSEPLNHVRKLANGEVVIVTDPRIRHPLRQILTRMLDRDPARRFPNADAVLAALDTMQTQESPRRHSDPALPRPQVPPTQSHSQPPNVAPPRSGTPRLFWLAALAVATGAGAGVAILALSAKPPAEPPAPASSTRVHSLPLRTSNEPQRIINNEHGPDAGAPTVVLSGCGSKPPHTGTGVLDTTDGLRRVAWRVHVPDGYDPNVPTPAVLLFHDDASDPQTIIDHTKLDDTADEHGFVLIAPEDDAFAPVWVSDVIDDVKIAFDATASELCIDRGRVFAVGHGSGANAVARLTCEDWLRGHVLASYVVSEPSFRCEPAVPAALLWFAPMKTSFQPPEGGRDCAGGTKISYDDYEAMWRRRNETAEVPVVIHESRDGVCRRWTGVQPFVSCRVNGGRPWPDSPPRRTDILNCDGPPPRLDFNGIIWNFLQSLD